MAIESSKQTEICQKNLIHLQNKVHIRRLDFQWNFGSKKINENSM